MNLNPPRHVPKTTNLRFPASQTDKDAEETKAIIAALLKEYKEGQLIISVSISGGWEDFLKVEVVSAPYPLFDISKFVPDRFIYK